jgi:hypothetical protein
MQERKTRKSSEGEEPHGTSEEGAVMKRRSIKQIQKDLEARATTTITGASDVAPSRCFKCGADVPVTKELSTLEGKPAVMYTVAFECAGGCKTPKLKVVAS